MILEINNVAEVTVYGEKNPIIGNIVCAKIRFNRDEEKRSIISHLKKYCRKRLQNYKVPVKIKIVGEEQYSNRFKKVRLNG